MINFKQLQKDIKLDDNRYYLIVAGSRGFNYRESISYNTATGSVQVGNYEIAEALLNKKLEPVISKGMDVRIIHGDARGADKIACFYALNNNYWHKEFVANWDTHGKRAGMIRNESMYTYASLKKNRAAIVFWDGESSGTRNNFLCAANYNVKILCYNYVKQEWMKREDIEDLQRVLLEEQRFHY